MLKNKLLLISAILSLTAGCSLATSGSNRPELYFPAIEPNAKAIQAEDVEFPKSEQLKIIVVTHGWLEQKLWPKEMVLAMREKVDSNEWLCGWFDWRNKAMVLNPRDAAQYARKKAGPILAQQILKLSKNPEHVHLIGHSSGCWVISEAAKIIAKRTNASIHLTFLDAYVPLGWDTNELGILPNEPGHVYWADHYVTRDITLVVTDCKLGHAHNVNIDDITPGLRDHEFPRFWYPATVIGKYLPKDRYSGKTLYTSTETTEYGFARSLEAGEDKWNESLRLPMGNTAVKIAKPAK